MKLFNREKKLKRDPTPGVGGRRFFIIFNCFPGEKQNIRENKLKTDPTPEVGGGGIFIIFDCFPGEKNYYGKQTKK